jgi:hypothetical protein
MGSLYVNTRKATEIDIESLKIPIYEYETVVVCNATSQSGPGAWGAIASSAILQDFLFSDDIELGPKLSRPESFNLTFVNHPLPLSK